MKKRLLVIIFIFIYSTLFSQDKQPKIFGTPDSLRLFFNLGVAYNLKLTTDYLFQEYDVSLNFPFEINFDYRFKEWFSLNFGLYFAYNFRTYSIINPDNTTIDYYMNSLFIRLPFNIKFHPFVYKSDDYRNFYVGIGLFPHFWPVNTYYYKYREEYYGDNYTNQNENLIDGKLYTPVNFGTKFSIGNAFVISKKALFSFELYAEYLFLPYTNGYYYGINYKTNSDILLEFAITFGVSISFGIQLMGGNG